MSERPKQPIQVFTFGSGWGVPFGTGAPFPLKLEAWLRMAGLPYQRITENDTRKGPKGKSPWIVDGELKMGDSGLIIEHLGKRYGIDLDARLSPADRAVALAWRRLFEEHYHQAFEHQLFFGAGSAERAAEFLVALPAILRPLVKRMVLGNFRKQLYARGVGRHSEAEIVAMGRADLDAAEAYLGDRAYWLGDEPSTIDATVFGFLGVTIYVSGSNPLFRHAASLPRLCAYTERMRKRYFPETYAGGSK